MTLPIERLSTPTGQLVGVSRPVLRGVHLQIVAATESASAAGWRHSRPGYRPVIVGGVRMSVGEARELADLLAECVEVDAGYFREPTPEQSAAVVVTLAALALLISAHTQGGTP